jgi:hypothetical protein
MLGHRTIFGVADLWHLPDPIRQSLVVILPGIDELPNLL